MKYKLAKIISTVFHPVILLIVISYLVLSKEKTAHIFRWEFFSVFLVLAIILGVLIGIRRGIFSNMDISVRTERNEFYVFSGIAAVIFFFISVFFGGIHFPLTIGSIGIFLGIMSFAWMNKFMKISIHAGVASSFFTAVLFLYGLPIFMATVWILLLVVWSRKILHQHSNLELLIGAVVGFLVTAITFMIAKTAYMG